MSHNRNHIIIQALVATGLFPESAAKLTVIGDKPGVCSIRDSEAVAKIVKKKLREPLPVDEQD